MIERDETSKSTKDPSEQKAVGDRVKGDPARTRVAATSQECGRTGDPSQEPTERRKTVPKSEEAHRVCKGVLGKVEELVEHVTCEKSPDHRPGEQVVDQLNG
jgi:hypothetical protein